MTNHKNAWKISERDFPQNASDAEKLAFFVRYAVLAPSSYNTQPWQFRVEGNTVSIFADRRYGLAVLDPDDREMVMACGAALMALRLAIRHFGYSETTELQPDPENEDLMARVKLGAKVTPAAEDRENEAALFAGMTKRHTNRGAFAAKDVPDDVLRALKSAAAREGAWLHVCSPVERKKVIRLIAEGDMIQTGNKHFRRELASWIDPRRMRNGDGMPESGLKYEDVMNSFQPSIARRFENDGKQVANDQQLDEGSPVIAVLGGKGGSTVERLYAGQALMRILLQAEAAGLSASMLNQPCEVPELRLRLHDEIEHSGRAHMIIRFGYGGKPQYTPRRPMQEVLEVSGRAPKGRPANDPDRKGLFGNVKSLFKR